MIRIPGKLKKKKIAVLYGGASAERPVSLKTGKAISRALKQSGLEVYPVDTKKGLLNKLARIKPDVAFIALHGPGGEDGTVQGLLELLGIPYTGSGVLASSLAMNKYFTKKVFAYHRLPIPEFILVGKNDRIVRPRFWPVVVKPVDQGSTIGISIVSRRSKLAGSIRLARRYSEDVLIERYIQGRELTVGIVGDTVLPVMEIVSNSKAGFYDYEAKYRPGLSRHLLPAPLSKHIYKKCRRLASSAFGALGCSGCARVDMILEESSKKLYILEVNTIPGMTPTSLVPESASFIGWSFEELVLRILMEGQKG